MLQYMNYWFGVFLFAGFLIPLRDMYWPFELFYYILPFQYYVRSAVFNFLHDTTWEPCFRDQIVGPQPPVCVPPRATGTEVLTEIGRVYPLIEADDNRVFDLVILLVIAAFFKITYIIGVYVKTSKTSKIK